MVKKFSYLGRFFLILCLIFPAYAEPKNLSEGEGVFKLLTGFLLAEKGQFQLAHQQIGETGIQWQNPLALQAATRLALQAKNIAQALNYVEHWQKLGGGVEAKTMQAELYLLSNQIEKAEPLLKKLMQNKSQTNSDLLNQLSILPNKQQAVRIGERIFAHDAEGQFHLAILALRSGEFLSAEKAIMTARQLDKNNLTLVFTEAVVRQTQAGNEAALPVLEKFSKTNCNLQHCSLDAILWGFSQYLRNEQEWKKALTQNTPANALWAVSAGNWYEQWKMIARAKAAYQRAGNIFSAQLGLSRIAKNEKMPELALSILESAKPKDVDDYVTRETSIAELLDILQGKDAAIERLQAAQKAVPNNFSLLYNHALYLENSGETEQALSQFRKLVQTFPNNAHALNALGYVMADNNIDLDEAQMFIERALYLNPNDPNIIDSLGWLHYRRGELAKARLRLEQATQLSDAAEIATHLGEVLWKMGNIENAKRIWAETQEKYPDNEVLNETIQRFNPF